MTRDAGVRQTGDVDSLGSVIVKSEPKTAMPDLFVFLSSPTVYPLQYDDYAGIARGFPCAMRIRQLKESYVSE